MLAGDLIDGRAERFRRWFSAAVLIAATHVCGGTLAMMQWPDEPDAVPSGAVVMDLAALAVAPPDPQDLAIGPEMEDATPTPPPLEASTPEEIELPPLEETPLAPDPEVVLPRFQPVEEVEEAEKEPELLQTPQLSELSTASSVAAAPPRLEAALAETVKAQTAGNTVHQTESELNWRKEMIYHLNRHKRYPAMARDQHVQGVARVEFDIDADGKLIKSRLVEGSGSPHLDEEALAVLERASPFPAPPFPGDVSLGMPIEFRIR